MLLLLSPGADPCPELKALSQASQSGGFSEISLGQGQVNQAEAALQEACRNGSWILLSNLQLALNWLPRLEGFLRSPMCTSDRNSSTRIWLTTEECSGFYSGLAGLCLKLAYEPPEGVKRNVKKSLQQLQQRQSELGDVKKMVLLSWLHGILQERRRFVPQGWIKEYDWSEADLDAACELVMKAGSSGEHDDWEEGRGLLDVAVYGGRLQDDYDMRALRAILRCIWSREVYKGRQKLGGTLNVQEATLGDPVRAVDRLSDLESPQDYFGLPANAHRTWEKSASKRALALLKGILFSVIYFLSCIFLFLFCIFRFLYFSLFSLFLIIFSHFLYFFLSSIFDFILFLSSLPFFPICGELKLKQKKKQWQAKAATHQSAHKH